MVVEARRNGATPQDACENVILRILKMNRAVENFQVGFIALDKRGDIRCFQYKKRIQLCL